MKKVFVSYDQWNPQESYERMYQVLEDGNILDVGANVLGHSFGNAIQEDVKRNLEERYGDRLVVLSCTGYYSYSYTYKLKDVK